MPFCISSSASEPSSQTTNLNLWNKPFMQFWSNYIITRYVGQKNIHLAIFGDSWLFSKWLSADPLKNCSDLSNFWSSFKKPLRRNSRPISNLNIFCTSKSSEYDVDLDLRTLYRLCNRWSKWRIELYYVILTNSRFIYSCQIRQVNKLVIWVTGHKLVGTNRFCKFEIYIVTWLSLIIPKYVRIIIELKEMLMYYLCSSNYFQ